MRVASNAAPSGASMAKGGAGSAQGGAGAAGAAANGSADAAGRSGAGGGPNHAGEPGQPGANGAAAETSDSTVAAVTPAGGVAAVLPTTLTPDATGVSLQSDLLFDIGSYTLNAHAKAVLGRLVAAARAQHRRGLVEVNGYTDDVGGDAYNLGLSKRRAGAVAKALQGELGDEGMTFHSNGLGEKYAVKGNTLKETRQKSRRVNVIFQRPAVPAPGTP
jgi:outer membrane protein OmpA-like peptidoglycan-associated protein